MTGVFADLLRIRSLREEKAERALILAKARVQVAEKAVEQAANLLEQFTREMPKRIDEEYARLEEDARRKKGIALYKIQNFRSFEAHMHTRREEMNLALVAKQKTLKQANNAQQEAHGALMQAMRARMKIEQLQIQERAQNIKEQERNEEKQLEEFKPQSIFAQLQ